MKALNLIHVGDPANETFTLNLGPQHPATHGVLRVKLVMDGEYITSAQPVPGYIHRMHEKMGENRTWALKLELLRLASNVPLVWLAPLAGLWPASAVGWVGLLSYSLISGIGLYCCRNRFTRLAS